MNRLKKILYLVIIMLFFCMQNIICYANNNIMNDLKKIENTQNLNINDFRNFVQEYEEKGYEILVLDLKGKFTIPNIIKNDDISSIKSYIDENGSIENKDINKKNYPNLLDKYDVYFVQGDNNSRFAIFVKSNLVTLNFSTNNIEGYTAMIDGVEKDVSDIGPLKKGRSYDLVIYKNGDEVKNITIDLTNWDSDEYTLDLPKGKFEISKIIISVIVILSIIIFLSRKKLSLLIKKLKEKQTGEKSPGGKAIEGPEIIGGGSGGKAIEGPETIGGGSGGKAIEGPETIGGDPGGKAIEGPETIGGDLGGKPIEEPPKFEGIDVRGKIINIYDLLEYDKCMNFIENEILAELRDEKKDIEPYIDMIEKRNINISNNKNKYNEEYIKNKLFDISSKIENVKGNIKECDEIIGYAESVKNEVYKYKEDSIKSELKKIAKKFNKIYEKLENDSILLENIILEQNDIYKKSLDLSNKKIDLSHLDKYKSKLDEESFKFIKSAENTFFIVKDIEDYDDWNGVYMAYFRFLEREIRNIGKSKNKDNLNKTIQKLKDDTTWANFIEMLERKKIREYRNNAAHVGAIDKKKVLIIRNFIFDKSECDGKICWLDFIIDKKQK